MSTITSKFSTQFDPSNLTHVIWLGKFFEFTETLAEKRNKIDDFLNSNPMGITVKSEEMMDWVQIHFIISMKYAQAVFKGTAKIIGRS
jgi:hypothetical protein